MSKEINKKTTKEISEQKLTKTRKLTRQRTMREQVMFQVCSLQKLEHIHQSDPSSDIISSQIDKMEKLELQLKHCQDALAKSNQQVMVKEMEKIKMEREFKTEARLLERENTENRFITRKLYKLAKKNDELNNKLELEHN